MFTLSPKLRSFLLAHKAAVAGFVLSACAAVYISVAFLADAVYFGDPRHQDEELRAWMTPRYVEHSYGLPREVVFEVLGIDRDNRGPKRLDRLASGLGLTLEELTEEMRDAAERHRDSLDD